MRLECINPFISATVEVFNASIGLNPQRSNLSLKQDLVPSYDVSVITGLSGDLHGSMALSFPSDSARKMIGKMLGGQDETDESIVADGIGELANMIAGRAKHMLYENELKIFHSIPRVIMGKDHFLHRPKGVPCISIEFQSDLGKFVMEIALKASLIASPNS